jgi:hypothetical protein
VIAVPVGHDHEVQLREVDVFRFGVLGENVGVVSCIEQNAFAAIFDKSGETGSGERNQFSILSCETDLSAVAENGSARTEVGSADIVEVASRASEPAGTAIDVHGIIKNGV